VGLQIPFGSGSGPNLPNLELADLRGAESGAAAAPQWGDASRGSLTKASDRGCDQLVSGRNKEGRSGSLTKWFNG